jgi:glycosyltransferase involved in cell wall biosynthesis
MKKIKIGYITKYFYPIQGGAETNILHIAQEAAADGHEVHIFTSGRKDKQKARPLEDTYKGIHIHRSRTWFDFTLYLGFYPGLLFKLLKSDLDIVHASGFGFIWNDIVLILKKLVSRKTKFINTPHGPFMALRSYNIFLKAVKSVYTFIQRIFLNWLYDAVIQVNTFQWRWMRSYGIPKSKIHFVPNGITTQFIDQIIPHTKRADFIKRYDLEKKYVISYMGRITHYKGIQDVISILPKLVKMKPNLIFLVMGRDDGYMRTLKVLAEKEDVLKYVHFIPDIPEDEKILALDISDIFVFPSEWEAFGIVLLEAMARKNAVISTKTEGGNYLITEGVNGLLYDYSDQDALFERFERMFDKPAMVEKMQIENIKKVKEFRWDKIYEMYYSKLLYSLM